MDKSMWLSFLAHRVYPKEKCLIFALFCDLVSDANYFR